MLLHSLNVLYDRLKDDEDYHIAPPGYSSQKITFQVVLTQQGALFEIQDVREREDRGYPRPKVMIVPGGTKSSGSGLNPCFLWDNSGYLLGYKSTETEEEQATEEKRVKRNLQTFAAFREKHLTLEGEIASPSFSAVCRFLERWNPEDAPDHLVLKDAAKTGFGVFQIVGQTAYIHDDPAVSRWWQSQDTRPDEGVSGQCLVTGRKSVLARTHRAVKGFGGTGAAIVSFNERAYESYGKKQSFNAPVSEDVAFRYVTALNALLDGPNRLKHRFLLGDTTVAFWTDRSTPTEDIFTQFITQGSDISLDGPANQDEGIRLKIEAFLKALRQGREAYGDMEESAETTPFFLLGVASNRARIAVRFFHQGTLADLLNALRQHHLDIRVAPGARPGEPEFPPLQRLLEQTCPLKNGKPDREKISPILAGPLLRAIVLGARYPEALYGATVRRLHAGAPVSYLRACVIKGYLNRNLNKEVSVTLDSDRTDPAYRLGRLFAALEKTQKDALGETLNKTIRDSFYSAASATPGIIFPRLLRTYQHHLSKLEGGRRINREKLVQAIFAPLEHFPTHLGLSDQGLFAIGYYHQIRDFYTKHESADETKDTGGGE